MTRKERFFTIGTAARLLGTTPWPAECADMAMPRRFQVDSRNVARGDAFVAMPGERDDGHNYIAKACEAGAACIILNASYYETHADELRGTGAALLPVPDSEAAMGELARVWLEQVAPVVVGITGSVGKTSTREFLYHTIRGKKKTHAAEKSYNTLIGCSMTVLSMPEDTEVLILELGTNHPGEIAQLVRHFPVTHGVITEIAPVHLEGLGTLDGVLDAKMEIAGSKGLIFLSYNIDNDALTRAIARFSEDNPGVRAVGVGAMQGAVRISGVNQSVAEEGDAALAFTLTNGNDSLSCRAPIFGRQQARNLAYAYAVSRELGMDDDAFCAAVASVQVPAGRGRISQAPSGNLLIDESYNANPSSVSSAIKNVLEMELPASFSRVAILGGMRELGSESAHWHEVVMCRASLFDDIYLIGDEWEAVGADNRALRGKWRDAEAFAAQFDFSALSHAVVLIKGSRYYELERLLPRFEVR